jgi:hypothetical protein
MRLFFRRSENFLEAQKQDQSGILAQIFLLVWKSSAGIFPRAFYSCLERIALSSAAQVTAAETVQK